MDIGNFPLLKPPTNQKIHEKTEKFPRNWTEICQNLTEIPRILKNVILGEKRWLPACTRQTRRFLVKFHNVEKIVCEIKF